MASGDSEEPNILSIMGDAIGWFNVSAYRPVADPYRFFDLLAMQVEEGAARHFRPANTEAHVAGAAARAR
jgi:hypothetical protein